HLMSKVRGLFEKFEGTIVTGDAPSATASIDLSSINTRDENRDAHLRSGDFFDVENHGAMTFASTKVEQGGKGLLVTGDLSIKGVTKPVTIDVEVLGTESDPWGGTRAGFEGTTSISRKEFGVDFNIPMDGGRLLVGDKIDITISAQAVLQQGE
ncbi:MAG: YceI family protein, partial [Nocardioides sp.]